MNSTTRRQQTAEAELRRVISRIPDAARVAWSQSDYVDEMLSNNPALGKWIRTKSGAEGFWRRQKTLQQTPPLRLTNDGSAPPLLHKPYVERTLDTAAEELRREWLPIQGTLRHRLIHKSQLNICSEYQRNSINAATVDRIASNLDIICFGALVIGQRDNGEYYIVDGQNRWMASQRRQELGELNCMVFQSLGVEHEARIFAAININRTGVKACDKYRAMVTGRDVIAVRLSEALLSLGIEVVASSGKGPNQLVAIDRVYKMMCRNPDRCEIILTQAQ